MFWNILIPIQQQHPQTLPQDAAAEVQEPRSRRLVGLCAVLSFLDARTRLL